MYIKHTGNRNMKTVKHVVTALVALSSLGFAGGKGSPVFAPVVLPVEIEEDNGYFYLGATLAYQRTYATDSTFFGKTDTQDATAALGLVAGYNFNAYIALEGRVATTVYEEDYAEVTTYSVFVKPQYPVSEDFSVYALLGFGNVNVTATDAGGNEFGAVPAIVGNTLMDESGFQWGLGVSYAMTDTLFMTFDYVSFASDAEINPTPLYAYSPSATYTEMSDDSLNLGLIYKF